jgi:hypothetical protein
LLIGEYREDRKLYFIKRLTAGLNAFNRGEILKAVQDLKTNRVLASKLAGARSILRHLKPGTGSFEYRDESLPWGGPAQKHSSDFLTPDSAHLFIIRS